MTAFPPPTALAPLGDLYAQLQASLGDEYALERELPGTPTARVFIARERIFNRAILVTVLAAQVTDGLDFERFASDVERAAALNHPNIVPPLMLGVAAGLPYIITPYVPGVTLRERLLEQPPLSLEEIVAILRALAEALHAAHAAQLLHLDVHPGTILVSQRAALLTDFGTVRALRAARPHGAAFVGDPSYLAPEQLLPEPRADQHADVYAWGAVAYEMLTGMTPSPRSVRDGRVVEARYEEPAPITLVRRDVPATLIRLIMRALSHDAADRPASAENVLTVLQTVDVSEKAQAERSLTPAYVPTVQRTTQAAPVAVKPTRVLTVVQRAKALPRRTVALAGGGVLAFAAIVALLLRPSPPPEEPPLPAAAPAVAARSTVVLPFAVAGGSESDAGAAAGLAVDLTRALTRRGLVVKGSGSAAALAAERLDPRTVARRLGVATILTGSGAVRGDSVLLDVALLSAKNGTTIWRAAFRRALAELPAVQDSVTRAVAGVVLERAIGADGTAAPSLASPAAHLLVLQGDGLASQTTLEALSAAAARYRSAIALDSANARAHAGLALTQARLSAAELTASPGRLAGITTSASRALALDSLQAPAYTALAYVKALGGANRDAEALFRKALSRDSSDAVAWAWFGMLAERRADHATAHVRIQRARRLEPASADARAMDALVYLAEKNPSRAEQAARSIPRQAAGAALPMLVHVETLLAIDSVPAAAALMEARAGGAGAVDAEATLMLAYTRARAGDADAAREVLLAIRDAQGGALPSRATLAATLAALGDTDSGIRLLQAASVRSDPVLFFFGHTPRFQGLRGDPRGAASLEALER